MYMVQTETRQGRGYIYPSRQKQEQQLQDRPSTKHAAMDKKLINTAIITYLYSLTYEFVEDALVIVV